MAAAMLGFSGTSPKSKPGRGVRAVQDSCMHQWYLAVGVSASVLLPVCQVSVLRCARPILTITVALALD